MNAPIAEVDHVTIVRLFRHAYRAERLGFEDRPGCRWYASEFSAGALWVAPSGKLARVKATITLPEWRGMGYGSALLHRLVTEAEALDVRSVEVFARDPSWYLAHGFDTVRVAKWGTTVLRRPLVDSTP